MIDTNTWTKIEQIGRAYGVGDKALQKWRLNGLPRRWQMDVWRKSREMGLRLTPDAIEAVSIPRREQ